MIMDHSNFRVIPEYQILMSDSPIAAIVASVLDTEQLWLFLDQIWIKSPGPGRRTPWHQDTTSWVAEGEHVCGLWMSPDPLAAGESLEFVRGSHVGGLRGHIVRRIRRDGAVLSGLGLAPAARHRGRPQRLGHHLVSFPNEPGDAVLFHPSTLHGGGAGQAAREGPVVAILRRRCLLLAEARATVAAVSWCCGDAPAG